MVHLDNNMAVGVHIPTLVVQSVGFDIVADRRSNAYIFFVCQKRKFQKIY